MRRSIATLWVVAALMVGTAGAASAHATGPCNDTDGDGEFSGREYAAHHIVPFAHAGDLGQGHKPGTHQGFSACNPSGK